VVPAGGGWHSPPFTLTERDGKLFGRGVVDNKGPAVIALHILKKLKAEGIKLDHRVRLIAGCNEENGSACLKYYSKRGEIPSVSIVPDADFPVINSEKGILQVRVEMPVSKEFADSVSSIDSGTRPNVVPDCARAVLKERPFDFAKVLPIVSLEKGDVSFGKSDGLILIETHGRAGHAMAPEKADNAAFKLFALFTALESGKANQTSATVHRLFCHTAPPQWCGASLADEKSGALTMNLGMVKYNGGALELTLDFRLPLCVQKDGLLENLERSLPKGSKVTVLHYAPNLFVSPDSPLIKTLLGAYSETTGLKPFTVQTGGGTYARELPNSVAFGPNFPTVENNIHNADEFITVKNFNALFDIYYNAILSVDKI
jgi:succinyl-diaminopimelate desuccinylase